MSCHMACLYSLAAANEEKKALEGKLKAAKDKAAKAESGAAKVEEHAEV